MNIDDWPLDKIMRLPDWCFGRRWWTGVYQNGVGGAQIISLAEETLPDKFIVWGVLLSCRTAVSIIAISTTMRLGSRVPANLAEAVTLERVLKNISLPTQAYELYASCNGTTWLSVERQIIEANGRSLVVVTTGDAANAYAMTVGVLISALPKEVPDWLLLGREENL